MRAQSECQSHALSGVGHDKKFRSSLFKGLRVQGSALGADDQALSSGYVFAVLRSGELEKPIKGVSIWEKGLDAPFPIPERGVNYRLRSHWNYVGRHGADKFSIAAFRRLSGGQSCDDRMLPAKMISRYLCTAAQSGFHI